MELQAITEQAKNSIPLPSRLAFQGKNSDSIYLDIFGIGRVEKYDKVWFVKTETMLRHYADIKLQLLIII